MLHKLIWVIYLSMVLLPGGHGKSRAAVSTHAQGIWSSKFSSAGSLKFSDSNLLFFFAFLTRMKCRSCLPLLPQWRSQTRSGLTLTILILISHGVGFSLSRMPLKALARAWTETPPWLFPPWHTACENFASFSLLWEVHQCKTPKKWKKGACHEMQWLWKDIMRVYFKQHALCMVSPKLLWMQMSKLASSSSWQRDNSRELLIISFSVSSSFWTGRLLNANRLTVAC